MAKSFVRPVDKLERRARVDGTRRQHEVERREVRNLNRMGWQEMVDDEEEIAVEISSPRTNRAY